ncbi:hypothetical protein Pan97_28740 [Bremerella volcania]|uniref:Sialate O-acetylesterase domain-containing protein n=1 Tax=Bremerella volcania TaxID=2527984 RepID=A0A518C9D7_9BACT|nr:sialate O-acetylesterase [Bremerella volcania]QDU75832.1 hypothetical protein Pan97_28740 [Bremerella volcania]
MKHLELMSVLVVGLLFGCTSSALAVDAPAVHLFLLSGQSNMANLDPDRVFTLELKKHFGADNIVVVKVAKRGQPIRRWYKDWKVTGDQNSAEIGDLYESLMKTTKVAIHGKSIQSVTLIWMQGERDAKEHLSDQYEKAFLGMLEQIKRDLNAQEVNYVIGRLSDWGLGRKDWDKIREVQQKLGEAGPRSAWVNTDDLNDDNKDRDGTPLKGSNHLHYSMAGYDQLAKRYVEKVKEFVK